MPCTRTPGIMVDAAGCRVIDKEHRGVRICLRLGPLSQEDAEYRLAAEITRVESQLEHKANSHPRFADCAGLEPTTPWFVAPLSRTFNYDGNARRPPDGQQNEIDSGKRYA